MTINQSINILLIMLLIFGVMGCTSSSSTPKTTTLSAAEVSRAQSFNGATAPNLGTNQSAGLQ